jgi:hypothetical protein
MNNQIRWAIYPPDALGNPTDFDGRRDFAGMDDDLKMTICFHALLLVSTFMEEYKRLEKIATATKDERLRITLETLEPAISRIREWDKGLSRVRNLLLAHPLRDGSKRFVRMKEIFADPSVPTSFAQMLTLGKYANLVVQGLATLYPSEAKQCWDWQESEDFKSEPRGITNFAEANEELKKTNKEIVDRIRAKGLRMGNPKTGKWL